MNFNLELMKYLDTTVVLDEGPTEYEVFGINWATDELLMFNHAPAHYSKVVEIVVESEDEYL